FSPPITGFALGIFCFHQQQLHPEHRATFQDQRAQHGGVPGDRETTTRADGGDASRDQRDEKGERRRKEKEEREAEEERRRSAENPPPSARSEPRGGQVPTWRQSEPTQYGSRQREDYPTPRQMSEHVQMLRQVVCRPVVTGLAKFEGKSRDVYSEAKVFIARMQSVFRECKVESAIYSNMEVKGDFDR
ncbi:unnamed protein product, partial [Scytosiphon promiscuus]